MYLYPTHSRAVPGLLLLGLLSAAAPGHGDPGEHIHGTAELSVVVDADSLLLELTTPAANLVGFEHPPRTDAERSAVDQARSTLEDGAALFVPNAEAECVQISHLARLDLGSAPDHDHGDEEVHADAHGEWAFTCAKPVLLSQLDVRLFEHFPGKERLRVELATSAGRRAVELTPDHHVLDL